MISTSKASFLTHTTYTHTPPGVSRYGVYSTSFVPPELAGVMVVLLDAILKHCADHKHVECEWWAWSKRGVVHSCENAVDHVMSSVLGHIANVVITAIKESK